MYRLLKIIKKYTGKNSVDTCMKFLTENNIKHLDFVEENLIPLKLYESNYIGGNIDKTNDKDDSVFADVYLNNNNNKYKIRLYKYTDLDDKNYKTINFIKIHSELNENDEFNNADQCAILILDTKIMESNIQSVNNYNDCIGCYYEKNKMYKIGDILIQSMISISIKKGMKKINLHDNSNYQCNKYNIPLIILRTLTYGSPFYTKYGFVPIDHNVSGSYDYHKNELEIYRDNKKLFKTKPSMTSNELISIIYYKKFDKKKDKIMLNYIDNVIIPRLKENNLISEFIKNIVNDSQNKIVNGSNNITYEYFYEPCELLDNIFLQIYLKCGYHKYIEKTFELNLQDPQYIKKFKSNVKLVLT